MDIHKKTHVSFIIQLRLNNEKTALNFTVISVGEWIFLVLIRGLKVWDKSNNFNWISGLLWTVCSSYTVHEWMRQKMWQRASSSTFQWSVNLQHKWCTLSWKMLHDEFICGTWNISWFKYFCISTTGSEWLRMRMTSQKAVGRHQDVFFGCSSTL